MKQVTKTLLTIWAASIVTFSITAVYIIPKEQRINSPGELGEVFAGTAFIILIILAPISLIIALISNNKNTA